MKNIIFKSIHIQNFKGVKDLSISFNNAVNTLKGMNATGKTTIVDAISWILFDEDSLHNSKFEIRPLDKNGGKIHHIDILVELAISIDGVEYTLAKVQKEKWVKKRGQEEAEYSGNVNEYAISGFPKSSKDFTAFISEIIDKNVFSLLTSPTAFPNLPWQEQRKLLMSIVGDISDAGLADEVEYYDLLEPELKIASIYDIKSKWSKSKNELKKKPDELQARIDEVSNSIVPDNSEELEVQRSKIKSQMEELEEKIKELRQKHDSREIDGKIAELRSKQNVLLINANGERTQSIKECNGTLNDLKREYRITNEEIERCTDSIGEYKFSINTAKNQIEVLVANIDKSEKAVFPESKGTCPTCGQKLPAEQYELAKNAWEKKRTEYIEKARLSIKEYEDSIHNWEEFIATLTGKIASLRKNAENISDKISEVDARLQEIDSQKSVYGTDIPEWVELENQIKELEASKMPDSEFNAEYARLNNEMQIVDGQYQTVYDQLATIAENTRKMARVEELKAELKLVGQKISDCDRMLFAVELYMKAIAARLNSKFSGVNFKLFDEQINGGIKETCEITYGGVPYGSLNSGHRIIVGLDIIKVLRTYFDITAPVLIDNSESISSGNIPVMDGQMILMKVTDDPVLVVN